MQNNSIPPQNQTYPTPDPAPTPENELPPISVTKNQTVPVSTPSPEELAEFFDSLQDYVNTANVADVNEPAKDEIVKVRKELITALNGKLAVSPVPATYQFAMFVVGALMCCFVLVYFGIIIGGFVGLYLYADYLYNNFDQIVGVSENKDNFVASLIVFSPFLFVGILLIFMLKPLIFRPKIKETRLEIKREQEPFLFHFLDQLCAYVGALPPSRVFVDCSVNASASFRHGIWTAISGGTRCDLTLGLPLVAGMNMNQLVGIIAHEFGHFTQGGGMRIGNIIRVITFWFARVVYERDWMDGLIKTLSTSGHVVNIAVFMVVRFFVWITRLILKGLMFLGIVVSAYLSRQMEFDADQFEARIIGSKLFRDSTRKLQGLIISNFKSNDDASEMFKDKLLADNFPRLIAANAKIIDAELQVAIDQNLERTKETGWFSTHPSDIDRINHAESIEAKGVIKLDCPATWLFDNFDTISHEATKLFYTAEIGIEINDSVLKNVKTVVQDLQTKYERVETILRYFQGLFHKNVAESFLSEPLTITALTNPIEGKNKIVNFRNMILQNRESIEKKYAEIDKLDADIWQLKVVTAVQSCKGIYTGFFTPEPPLQKYEINNANLEKLETQKIILNEQLENDNLIMANRISIALQMLCMEQIYSRIENGQQLLQRIKMIYKLEQELAALHKTSFLPIYEKRYIAMYILVSESKINSSRIIALHDKEVGKLREEIFNGLISICESLDKQQYPYEHAQGNISLKSALVPAEFDGVNKDILFLLDVVDVMYNRFGMLLNRICNELISAAEKVETILGLPLLPNLPNNKPQEIEPNEKKGIFARIREFLE